MSRMTRASITVYGERFEVDVDDEDGTVWVQHPRWSVLGGGRTLHDAEVDLHWCAKHIAEAVRDHDPAIYSDDGRAMQDWLIRNFLACNPPERRTSERRRKRRPGHGRRSTDGGKDG